MTKRVPHPLTVVAAAGAGVAAAALLRWRFDQYALARITQPTRSTYRANPAEFGLSVCERVAFVSNDGLTLRGRFFPAAAPAKVTVILLHGYNSTHDAVLEIAAWLVAAGYNVLAYDQRGCGQSDGERITLGYQEAHDVGAAIEWLLAHGHEQMAVMGYSMGGAVAILAAAEYTDLKAVITDCAYANIEGAIRAGLLEMSYPQTAADFLAMMSAGALSRHFQAAPSEYDSIHAVSLIAPRPLLLIHAGDDTTVDPSDAYALYDAAGEPRELWITPHAAHTDSYHMYRDEYKQRVLATLARAFGG